MQNLCDALLACNPRLTVKGRKRRLTAYAIALGLGLVILMLDARIRNALVKPGALIAAHAMINTDTKTNNCAACHSAEDGTTHGWINRIAISDGIHESLLCLDCHFGPGIHRLQPHSIDPIKLNQRVSVQYRPIVEPEGLSAVYARFLQPPSMTDGSIACATCHREHRGRENDLSQLQDLQCQACHQHRFERFSTDHPQLAPVERHRQGINFDHRQHQTIFPQDSFDCRDCHSLDQNGAMATTGYSNLCKGCHAQGADDYHGKSIKRNAFILLQQPDMEIESEDFIWPGGTGSTLSPLLWLLLAGDPQALPALDDLFHYDELYLDAEPYEWYPDDESLKIALVQSISHLTTELTQMDRDGLAVRLAIATGLEIENPALDTFSEQLLSSHFPVGVYARATADDHWDLPRQSSAWHVDAEDRSVLYRAVGHADPLLHSWLELLAKVRAVTDPATPNFSAELMKSIDDFLTNPKSGRLYFSCLQCHSFEHDISWRTNTRPAENSAYGQFRHRSHLTLGKTCGDCHQIEANIKPEFSKHSTTLCADCHHPDGASENCLTCHQYHYDVPRITHDQTVIH